MAYSRFTNSDIYIYPNVAGHIECAACYLNEPQDEYSLFSMSENITNDDQLRAHLEEHARAGHDMPENLLQDILADPDRYGRMIGYSTGKWSDDDDMHPTITPIFGPNR
jgi:hypothetical protein